MSTPDDRRLHLYDADRAERKVGWLELFYDLIYVATIIQLGDLLAADAGPAGAWAFVALFVPVWWSWTGMMFYFNRFVVDDAWHRVLVLAQMFAIATLAISVTGAFGDASVPFALSYAAIRLVLVLLYVRAWRAAPGARPLIRRYLIGFGLAAAFWCASAFVPPPLRFGLWAVGLALEFYVPLSAASRRMQRQLPPATAHFAERYGLFTIIVLGESFIKVVGGLADAGLSIDALLLAGLGFVVAASVWWLYFDRTHGAVPRAGTWARYLWIYGHLPLTAGITATGVALKKLALAPLGAPASDEVRWLFGGAVALCLAAFAALDAVERSGLRRRELVGRVAGACVVLAVTAWGAGLPAGAFVGAVAAVCALLVVASEVRPTPPGHA